MTSKCKGGSLTLGDMTLRQTDMWQLNGTTPLRWSLVI
jgi:hypothetical protein